MAALQHCLEPRPPLNCLVLGHSFIWRLNKYLGFFPYDAWFPPYNLFLSPYDFRVFTHGRSGATASVDDGVLLRENLPDADMLNVCDVVFLDIGSNDLCTPGLDPVHLAHVITELAKFLQVGHDVRRVIIGAILLISVSLLASPAITKWQLTPTRCCMVCSHYS